MTLYDFKSAQIPTNFFWLNEPKDVFFENGLNLITKANTDFWQTTHYGFQRDNGHCLLTNVRGDFSLHTRTHFSPIWQYDQCGLMVRLDHGNWIKCSVEFETQGLSRLGSVVTNGGYSDWSTQDIDSSVASASYRIVKRGKDFQIDHSLDGLHWHQMRIAHLHAVQDCLDIGIYACSPKGGGFTCRFEFIEISKTQECC